MLRVRFQTFDYNNETGLVIMDDRNGKRYVAQPLKFRDYTSNIITEPTLRIMHPYDESTIEAYGPFFRDWIKLAKTLGINLGEDFTKEREVLYKHLGDMRLIAFHKLNIKKEA